MVSSINPYTYLRDINVVGITADGSNFNSSYGDYLVALRPESGSQNLGRGGFNLPPTGSVSSQLISQAPVTQAPDIVIQNAQGQSIRFFVRDGVLHMSTSSGVQTGTAARSAFAGAVSSSPSLIRTFLSRLGLTAVTTIVAELLFPQPAGNAAADRAAGQLDLAVRFLREAAASDTTGSLVFQQQDARNERGEFQGYTYSLTNQNTGVVIAEVGNGRVWTNPNLNADGTMTSFSSSATLTAQQTNGALGSFVGSPDPTLGVTTTVSSQPTVTVNERPLTLTLGGASYAVTLRNIQSNGQSVFEVRYTGADGAAREYSVPNAQSFDSAKDAVVGAFTYGLLDGISTVNNATYTIPGTTQSTIIHHVQVAGGNSYFYLTYNTPSGVVSYVPILNAGSLEDASSQVNQAFISGGLRGLSARYDAGYTIPGTSYQTFIEHVVGVGGFDAFRVRYTINGENQLFSLNAQTLDAAKQEIAAYFQQGQLPGLSASPGSNPNVASDPIDPATVPTYPFPDIVDPWTTSEGSGVVEETNPQVRDPWEDEPDAGAGGDGTNPPTSGNGNSGGNGGGDDGVNGNGGDPVPDPTPPQRTRLFGTGLEQDLLIAAGQGVVNLVAAGSAALFYQGTETRTSGAIDQSNVLTELSNLQQNPDGYISSNYNNSFFGYDFGDRSYNINGHLFEMEQDGRLTYFRRVPNDIYQNLRQLQQSQGINNNQVFVNEMIDDGSGNRVAVWVEIRPPVRVEGYEFNSSVDGPQDGGNAWDFIDLGGSANATYGVDEGYSIGGDVVFSADPSSSGVSDRIRIGFPTTSQPLGIDYRTQDTTTFLRASAAYRSTLNNASVRDLTVGSTGEGLDGRIVFGESSVYFIAGQRSRNRIGVNFPDPTQSIGAYARVRDTTFIELGPAALFFGTEEANLNYYHELQLYPNDAREQLNIFPSHNRATGALQRFNAPTYRLQPSNGLLNGIENDVALQVTFSDGVDTMLALRDVETLNEWFPGLTQRLGVDGALDFISGLIHPENFEDPDPVRETVGPLRVSVATGANVPAAAALIAQSGGTALELADGSQGQLIANNNRTYLVVNGTEVFDVTGVGRTSLELMRLQGGQLQSTGRFSVNTSGAVTLPRAGANRTDALTGRNAPSVADLAQNGENTRTVRTADGLSLTVSDMDGRTYARVGVNGQTYIFDVTGRDIARSLFVPDATGALVSVSSLSVAGGPQVEDIIARGARLSLSDGRVAYFYNESGKQYVFYRARDGELRLYDVTGYDRTTIQQFLESLQVLAPGANPGSLFSDPNIYASSLLDGSIVSDAGIFEGGSANGALPSLNYGSLSALQRAALGGAGATESQLNGPEAAFRDVYKTVFAQAFASELAAGADFATAVARADTLAGDEAYVAFKLQSGYVDAYVAGYGGVAQSTVQAIVRGIVEGRLPPDALAQFEYLIASGKTLTEARDAVYGPGAGPVVTQTPTVTDAPPPRTYPPLEAEQLISSLVSLGLVLPGDIGKIARDAAKLQDLYRLGDALVKLADGKAARDLPGFVNGSTEIEDFVSAAASVIAWAIPEAADEIALAKKVHSLIDASITLANTPAQISAQIAGLQSAGYSLSEARAIVNPSALSAGNALAVVSIALSFVKEDWAKVASGAASIGSYVALISAGAINPVIGIIGIFAAFFGTVLGLSKPSTVPLGDEFDLTGGGAGTDSVKYAIGNEDFLYTVNSNQAKLDIDSVRYGLIAVDVAPNMVSRGDDRTVQDGWRLATAEDDAGDIVTKYFLDATFTFGGLFGGQTDQGASSLTKFSIDDGGRDGPGSGKVTGFEIGQGDYDRLTRLLGNSGTLDGADERIALLKDYVGDAGAVSFRQTKNDQGLQFYADINGDGVADLVSQDINIDKYRDGDGGASITLYDAVGREIVSFEADSLDAQDLRGPMNAALATVNVGPMEPIGLTQSIGPRYTVDLPGAMLAEGALTEDAIRSLAGLDMTSNDLVLASLAGANPPAWLKGWLPETYNGVTDAEGGRLAGDNKANLLFGFDGDDILNGRGGGDRLAGGAGDDRLDGGAGEDLLVGNDGADRLIGGKGFDAAYGGAGNDTLRGGADDDTLSGGTGRDRVFGDAGNDRVTGGAGADRLDGGEGLDILSYLDATRGVRIDLGRNTASGGVAQGDRISGFEGVDGGSGNDVLTGGNLVIGERDGQFAVVSSGENQLNGGAGRDRLYGMGGNDELIGGAGRDLLDGGDGNDVASYASSNAGVTVDLAASRGRGGDAAGDRLISVEGLFGSAGDDTLSGTDGENLLTGNAGADRLNGRGGNDMLQGGVGNDVLNGGRGNDMASFADLSTLALGVDVNLQRQTVGGLAEGDRIVSIEGVIGTAGRDTLTGSNGLNRFEGLDGDDVIDGGGGNDKLFGGEGNDVLTDLQGNNDLVGGAGDDRLRAGRGRDLLSGEAGLDILRSGGGNDLVQGGGGDDRLFGGLGADRILGGGGNDSLVGGEGADRLDGGAGSDRISAGRGDTVIGGQGHDTAVINARSREFEVQNIGGGLIRLIDKERGGNGVIQLRDVERIEFADGLYKVAGEKMVRLGDVPAATPTLTADAGNANGGASDPLGQAFADVLAVNNAIAVGSITNETTASFVATPAGTGVTVDLAANTAVVTPVTPDPAVAPVVQPVTPAVVNVVGTQSDDAISGDAQANAFAGLGGADVIAGLGGRDALAGGAGNDTLSGNRGADTISGGAGNDRIMGGAGRDTLTLQGSQNRYDISRRADGGYRVHDAKTGATDIVSGVEFVQFWNGKGDKVNLRDLVR